MLDAVSLSPLSNTFTHQKFGTLSYHKFQASQLFTGTHLLDEQAVLIINSDGVVEEITSVDNAGENIQQLSGILCPGFINAHCHLELSHLKGVIPEKTGLVDFVFQVVTQRHFPQEEIEDAIQLAETAMLEAGIVAVGDICNNTHTLAQKKLRRLHYHNFIEVSGWNPSIAQIRLDKSLEYFQQFKHHFSSHTSLSPHAPYSVSNALWNLLQPYFNQNIITIHNQEAIAENELFIDGSGDFLRMYEMMQINNDSFSPTGKNSLPSYVEQLSNSKRAILVHNSFTNEEDMLFAKDHLQSVSFCLCPNANLYIEETIPPIDLLRKHKAEIIIGTDSLASNHQLSVLDELKTIHQSFPHIPLQELLQWSTLNGAKALGMDNALGSFEKGKQPGVLLLHNIDTEPTSTTAVQRLI